MNIDCFGYEETTNGCRILKKKLCVAGGKCPFYKTHRQLEQEEARVNDRLKFLSLTIPGVMRSRLYKEEKKQ